MGVLAERAVQVRGCLTGGLAEGEKQDSMRHLALINNSAGSYCSIFSSETP